MVAPRPGRQCAYKFFFSRRPVDARVYSYGEDAGAGFAEYVNVSPRVGYLLSRDASLAGPLSTVLGLQDMYDLVEIAIVDDCNDYLARKRRKEQDQ